MKSKFLEHPTILSITGSDSTSESGIQADLRTITDLGGYALTAITAITVQYQGEIREIYDLPTSLVLNQVGHLIKEFHPQSVKVGMIRNETILSALCHEIVFCPHRIVVSGILNAQGHLLMPMSLLQAWQEQLLPLATLLIIKVNEAELLLDTIISSDQEMIEVASRLRALGAGAVLLRGGRQTEGLLTALLADEHGYRFFTSRNLDGWQRHGVGGALSSAIATRLAFGDSLQQAVTEAHTYMHSQVVYAVSATGDALRPADLYNRLMTFIADYHTKAHDVAFYANKLAITPRYLAQITARVVDKSPKQVIYDYLLQEALALLANTRLTIQEIAYRLGFSSQAMFTRFFNQQQGCSPSQYRLDL